MRFRMVKLSDFSVARDLLPTAYRYQPDVLEKLPKIWEELYKSGSLISATVQNWHSEKKDGIIGVGLSVFVNDDFAADILTSPRPFINSELHDLILSGESPVLTRSEITEANINGGLNLFPLHFCTPSVDISQPEVLHHLSAAQDLFWVMHAGYRIKNIIKEVVDINLCNFMQSTGMNLITDHMNSQFADKLTVIPENERPYLLSINQDEMPIGSQMSLMFTQSPVRFSFTAAEQRILLCALLRDTDEEMSRDLNIALDTIRKHWRSIYKRITDIDPDFFIEENHDNKKPSTRGKSKRRHILRYIKTHMEELRPHNSYK